MDVKVYAESANDCKTNNTTRMIQIKYCSTPRNTIKVIEAGYYGAKKNIARIIQIKYCSGQRSVIRIIEIGSYSASKNTIRIIEIKQEQKALAEDRLNVMPRHHGRTKQLSKQSMQKQYGFKTLPANPTT